jgi:hypothetical protein
MTSVTCPSCLHNTPVLTNAPGASAVCLRCRAPIPADLLAPPHPAGAETPAATTSTPGHPVTPYTGTPGGSLAGFVVVVVVGLIGAVVVGFAAAFLRQYFWFVLVFAMLYGIALGGITGLGVRAGKYRRPVGAASAGIIAGIAGAFLLHYFGYRFAIRDMPALAHLSFWQYMDFRCVLGTSIGGISLGYSGTAIYWGLEALVIVIASAVAATWPIKRPFCAACNTWKEKKPLGVFRIDGPRAVEAIATGQPAALAAPATADDKVTVSLFHCPRCGDAGGIEAEVSATRGKGEGAVTTTAIVSYPAEAAADFEAARRACEERGYLTK